MPILILRFGRAIFATFSLLTDRKVMRELPWRYIRTLPFSNPWIGLATLCLVGSIAATLVGLFVRSALNYAFFIAAIGVLVPAVRLRARSLRHRR